MSNNQKISFPRELSDELAELIAEKARVCGGGAFEIWEAICDQFGTQAQHQGEPVAWEMDDTAGDTGEIMVTNSRAVRDDWIRSDLPVCPLYGHPAASRRGYGPALERSGHAQSNCACLPYQALREDPGKD